MRKKSRHSEQKSSFSLKTDTKIVSTSRGDSFLLRRERLDSDDLVDGVEFNKLKEYIFEHRKYLSVGKLRKRFRSFKGKDIGKLLFFDIESSGLEITDEKTKEKRVVVRVGYSQISAVSFARVPKNINEIYMDILFARDASEEREMLRYALNQLASSDFVFTYNGTSFDLPHLSERARQNGLAYPGNNHHITIKEHLMKKHADLLREFDIKRDEIPDRKLSTIERLIIGHERQDGISGKDTPQAYLDYVERRAGNENVDKITYHCMLDSLRLVAVLEYLCTKKEYH